MGNGFWRPQPGDVLFEFDALAYADQYPDLKRAFGNNIPLLRSHYMTNGRREGRNHPYKQVNTNYDSSVIPKCVFDPSQYSGIYNDIQNAYKSDQAGKANHYYTQGMREGRAACFVSKNIVDDAINNAAAKKYGANININTQAFTNINSVDNIEGMGNRGWGKWGAMRCNEDINQLHRSLNKYKDNSRNDARNLQNAHISHSQHVNNNYNNIKNYNIAANDIKTRIQRHNECIIREQQEARAAEEAKRLNEIRLAKEAEEKRLRDIRLAEEAEAAKRIAAQKKVNDLAASGMGSKQLSSNAPIGPLPSTTVISTDGFQSKYAYNYNDKPNDYKVVDIYSNNMPVIEGLDVMSKEKEIMDNLVTFNNHYYAYINDPTAAKAILLNDDLGTLNPKISAYKTDVAGIGTKTTTDYINESGTIKKNHANVISMRQELDAKLKELYNTEDSISNDYKKRADSTIYTGILLSTVATSMLYYLFTEM